MKSKLSILTIIGLLAGNLAGLAQNTTPAPDAAPAAPPAAAPAEQPASAPAAQPAAAPAEQPAAPPADSAATAAPADASASGSTNAPSQPGAVLPLIVMDEVPLTDAIKNLARNAGLNYMLDPKISYGQVGPDGHVIPQPSVSIRWENITAEQALYALLNNYSLQLVEDPKSKIARISPKDPAAPEPLVTKIFQLKYANPSNILASVSATLIDKRSKVVPDIRTSQLIVLATEKEQAGIEELVDRLDTPTRQVLIEARLLETSLNPKTAKGIDWSGTLEAQHISYGNGIMSGQSVTRIPGAPTTTTLPGGRTVTTTPHSSTTTILDSVLGNGGFSLNTASGISPNIGFLNADGVHAVLSFINEDATAKVLSTPRTVTLDNEPAHIAVVRATPIINVTAGTANTTGGSQIQYTNLGVILDVTPRISANNFVNLKVVPEVSRLFDTVTKVIGGEVFQADEYDLRRIETKVMIPSGNTLVLGGLVTDDVRDQSTKVPGFGDIPFLGYAFRSQAKQRQKNNLIIFITPTIVTDTDFQPTTTAFMQTPLKDSIEGDWSVWDTTKPYDWKKPVADPDTVNGHHNPTE